MVLKEFMEAPDFALPDQLGVVKKMADFRGKRLVLYFYPKDDTPGCTKEACSLSESYDAFIENGIAIVGISYDSVETHAKFAQKYNLPFSLLSDSLHVAAKAYGAAGLFMPKRKTFLIDERGMVIKIIHDVDVVGHADDVLSFFKQWQHH